MSESLSFFESSEISQSITDFGPVIADAFANSPVVEPNAQPNSDELAAHNAWWEQAYAAPDYGILDLGNRKVYPGEIVTEDPNDFRQLIRQSYGLPATQPGPDKVEAAALNQYNHESAHAARVPEPVQYSVQFSKRRQADGSLMGYMLPSIKLFGTIRKIDYAMIVAAPETPSDGDKNLLAGLGFVSVAQVLDRYKQISEQ